MIRIPRLIRFGFVAVVLQLALYSSLRLAFWLWFNSATDPLAGAELATAFYLGLKFDLRLALFVVLPLLVVGWWRPLSPFASARGQRLWILYLIAIIGTIVLVFLIHFGHYSYLQKTLDATALRFLENPLISGRMVWQSYPVVWGTLALLGLLVLLAAGLRRALRATTERATAVARWQTVAISVASAVLVVLGLYGQWSWYPLRWSNAFFSTHPLAPAVTVNPVLHVVETLKNREVSFDRDKALAHYPELVHYLGIDRPDPQGLNYARVIKTNNGARRPNVVLVLLESFAAYKTGIYGNPLNPTPKFDAIARSGIYFKNFFVPHTGTARSVFTAVTGLPDIEAVRTSSRNPLVVNQHTIINAFEGYEKFYFLGGSANWGNIRGLLARNIPGLHIYEEGSYRSPRQDVWGIADHHLLEEASEVLKEVRDKPFFAIIQTAGNHRPYTIPEDRHGFEFDNRDDATMKRYGFLDNGEYNSFRFLDHSIGIFIDQARRASYFDNTLFVFLGDHGVPGSGEHLLPADQQLELYNLRVPLVLYAPKLLGSGRVIDTVASEVDLLPTIAGRILPEYRNTTLGRDLIDRRFDDRRYAFTMPNAAANPEIGLLGDGFYFLTRADGTHQRLHRLNDPSPRRNVLDEQPDVAASLRQLCFALYETVRYMRYHNREQPPTSASLARSGS